MPYEEFGYVYADSLMCGLIDSLAQNASEWIGRPVDPQKIGRDLSTLCLAVFQLSLVDLIPGEDASGRAIGGFMKRITERYENFAFDKQVTNVGLDYIRAAGEDFRNKQKKESFPHLSSLALNNIAGIDRNHRNWPVCTEMIYTIIENVLKTSRAALKGVKDHAKLV